MNKLSSVLTLAGLLLFSAHAEEPRKNTPEKLYAIAQEAADLPQRSAWQIDIGAAPGSSAPPPKTKSILSKRIGNLQHDEILWADGKTSEAWHTGNEYLANDPRSGNCTVVPGSLPISKLQWLSWISPRNLAGVETFGGVECAVFAGNVPWIEYWPGYFMENKEDDHPAGIPLRAYINLQERRLLAVQWGDNIARFTWLQAPEGSLELPQAFVRERDKVLKKIKAKSFGLSQP